MMIMEDLENKIFSQTWNYKTRGLILERLKSTNYDLIIIGGGISGLACAKNLTKHDKAFIIISKDIGGRILTSKDKTANYGAFFVCSDYHHILKHVKTKIKGVSICLMKNQSKSFVSLGHLNRERI